MMLQIPKDNDYHGTTIQQFCFAFTDNHFTEAENSILIETYKFDADYHTKTKLDDRDIIVDFDVAENILTVEKVFPLSAEEVNNEQYGFHGDESRVATYNGEAANWWLRFPHDDSFLLDAGFAFANGWQADLYINGFSMLSTSYTVRLAMNIDTNRILYLTDVSEYRDPMDEQTIWKLTIQDDAYSEFRAKKILSFGKTCLLRFDHATVGENEYISAIIINSSSGEITYYGTIENNKVSGSGWYIFSDFMNEGDSLCIYSEQKNENLESNSASELIKMYLK